MQLLQFAHGYYDDMMGGQYGDMGWAGMFIMLLFWVLIIGFIVLLVRSFMQQNGRTTGSHRDPLDIARERYAKGEISKEELTDIAKTLK